MGQLSSERSWSRWRCLMVIS